MTNGEEVLNFGQINIHELDKNKSYICEVKITEHVPVDELSAYLHSVKDAFDKAGITNVVLIPTGGFAPIQELNIKKDMNQDNSYD